MEEKEGEREGEIKNRKYRESETEGGRKRENYKR